MSLWPGLYTRITHVAGQLIGWFVRSLDLFGCGGAEGGCRPSTTDLGREEEGRRGREQCLTAPLTYTHRRTGTVYPLLRIPPEDGRHRLPVASCTYALPLSLRRLHHFVYCSAARDLGIGGAEVEMDGSAAWVRDKVKQDRARAGLASSTTPQLPV